MYPHDREIPERLLQELLGILVHAGVGMLVPTSIIVCLTNSPDYMTSSNSTAAYSEGELKKLLSYVKHIASIGGNCGFSACVVGQSNVPESKKLPSRTLRPLDELLQYVAVRV